MGLSTRQYPWSLSFGLQLAKADAISIVCQLQEKYMAVKKNLRFAFVDLEKAFDHVSHTVIWWSIRKLALDEWVLSLVNGMYGNAKGRV